jgi:hypothetical protein
MMKIEKRTELIAASLNRIVDATKATIRKADNTESNPVTEAGRLAVITQEEAGKLSHAGMSVDAVGTFLICAHFISGQVFDEDYFAKLMSLPIDGPKQ